MGGWVATVATVWVATAAYRGGHLIQVTNTAFVWAKIQDFEKWPLNRGWPLNTGPLVIHPMLESKRCTGKRKTNSLHHLKW